MSIEAMRQALEALEIYKNMLDAGFVVLPLGNAHETGTEAVVVLREVLAHPAPEPFGYFRPEPFGWTGCAKTDDGAIALYEAPPPRQPLTTEQIMANAVLRYYFAINGGEGPISKQGRKIIDAIEAAHGIKGQE
jgi:hypothetical protein